MKNAQLSATHFVNFILIQMNEVILKMNSFFIDISKPNYQFQVSEHFALTQKN
jgi:hypothetical protein